MAADEHTDVRTPAGRAEGPPPGGRTRGHFPSSYLVGKPGGDGRCVVVDPETRRRWSLGPAELSVARRFHPGQTYEGLARALRGQGRHVSPERLVRFEERLVRVGLLRADPEGAPRRPGLVRGLSRRVPLDLSFRPDRMLDAVHRAMPWLVTRWGAALLAAGSSLALGAVGARWGRFAHDVPGALRGTGLLLFYAACLGSALFHEVGHATACRAYGLAVDEIGFGLRSLTVFAWTEPEQDRWSALPVRARMVTIAAGPLGSLVFAALGGAAWLWSDAGGAASRVGLVSVLAGTVAVVPTLLPVFQGDAYLVLSDVLGYRNLRQRSFDELRRTFLRASGTPRPRWRARAGYLCFGLAVMACRIALTAFMAWLIWVCTVGAR